MELTLEKFFNNHADKAVDFNLRAIKEHGKWIFYIHPANINGDTWDFEVSGNQLICTAYPSTLNVEQPPA